ncbi:DedA family protein [Erythrobacter dokdonensis]|uniref:Alkaline phosphatase n=1 Tax=Erythrobacter dokdonensis DSW-74 TaxID=1300349 RepID=A0A1A7BJG6_9SPHN|nr:DedA family protein [Erythrobacter dokdonensis]OBV12619.1 alkaline phosphatase [Erythrobacter dokdonensis DSW-74]
MTEILLELLDKGGYLGIFLLMAAENIFPPIPSEVIMGAAGVLVARGQMTFMTLWIVATAGTVAGNLFWFWLGVRWSEETLKKVIDRWGRWLTFEWDEFLKARDIFRKYGDWIVFLLRFSPILRTIVSLPAGLARMKLWRFVLFTALGSAIWNGILIFGGKAISGLIDRYETLAGYGIVAFVLIGVAIYIYRVMTWEPVAAFENKDD